MQNVPYLIFLYLRLMHLRERSDRTSHAAYPAARRTTNLAVLFSLNYTFHLIDVKQSLLLQQLWLIFFKRKKISAYYCRRNTTGKVNLTFTALPSCLPGIHLGIARTTRSASTLRAFIAAA